MRHGMQTRKKRNALPPRMPRRSKSSNAGLCKICCLDFTARSRRRYRKSVPYRTCSATLKLFENPLRDRVSEVHAVGIRKENNAIEPEDVECVGELLQGGIDIRQGEAGETSKTVRPCLNEFGREFVTPARQSPRSGAISRFYWRPPSQSSWFLKTGSTSAKVQPFITFSPRTGGHSCGAVGNAGC